MLRFALIFIVNLLLSANASCQLKKIYTLKGSPFCDTIDFYLKATASNWLIQRSSGDNYPITIYGNPDTDKITPSFISRVHNNTCSAKLKLDDHSAAGFSDRFTFAASRREKDNDFWKVGFGSENIYRLYLNYGFGYADVDLTGSSIQKFRLRSGSADIVVGYDHGSFNPIAMDTFFVKVDFGSIETPAPGDVKGKKRDH